MYKYTKLALMLVFMIGIMTVQAQNDTSADANKVLIIGENEGAYEELVASCPDMLLMVAGNSMEEAFNVWSSLLTEMQDHSDKVGFDLQGVKMWINFFWNEDGTIDKIVYYPKPTSKNMDFDLLTDFLNDFARIYVLPLDHTRCFSQYGSASFPHYIKSE